MGRNATISIWNKTNGDFIFESDDVIHGKYQKDRNPPQQIGKDQILSFEVGNRTGAKIGPKGKVVYKTVQANGDNFKVIVDWDHPFSASTSSYHCYSDPLGKVSAVLSPNHPTGHDQSITWTVEAI